ncbi:hypothetical protein H4582DRAFT_2058362 [Lactarius indigo]|nr:hypothetical protein H4582DRAFT_2058362 [Lactarius indigo]
MYPKTHSDGFEKKTNCEASAPQCFTPTNKKRERAETFLGPSSGSIALEPGMGGVEIPATVLLVEVSTSPSGRTMGTSAQGALAPAERVGEGWNLLAWTISVQLELNAAVSVGSEARFTSVLHMPPRARHSPGVGVFAATPAASVEGSGPPPLVYCKTTVVSSRSVHVSAAAFGPYEEAEHAKTYLGPPCAQKTTPSLPRNCCCPSRASDTGPARSASLQGMAWMNSGSPPQAPTSEY